MLCHPLLYACVHSAARGGALPVLQEEVWSLPGAAGGAAVGAMHSMWTGRTQELQQVSLRYVVHSLSLFGGRRGTGYLYKIVIVLSCCPRVKMWRAG